MYFLAGFNWILKGFLWGDWCKKMDLPICLQMIQFENINESLPRDLAICFSFELLAWPLPSPKLTQPLKIGLPKRKLVSQPPIFQGTCSFSGAISSCTLTQRPGGFSRKLMDSNRVPGIICALGCCRCSSIVYFFVGRRQPLKSSFKKQIQCSWFLVIQVFVG